MNSLIQNVRSVIIFFFQAEDGIRDVAVTGVQTCALPIWSGDHCASDPGDTSGIFLSNHVVENSNLKIFDIAPTVLKLLDVPPPSQLDGESLTFTLPNGRR